MLVDLKRLHKAHFHIMENGTYQRRVDKTVYFTSVLIGYLEVLENTTILFVIEDMKRLNHNLSLIHDLLFVNNIKPTKNSNKTEIRFSNNSNTVKIISFSDSEFDNKVRGYDYNIIPIADLDDLSPEYFQEPSIFKLIEHKKYRIGLQKLRNKMSVAMKIPREKRPRDVWEITDEEYLKKSLFRAMKIPVIDPITGEYNKKKELMNLLEDFNI